MGQLALFSDTTVLDINRPDFAEGASLEERFEAFHRLNPHIYQELVGRGLALREKGIRRFGIAALFEAMRYDVAVRTGGDTYKLNNNYKAFYARLIMSNVVALKDFFETREQAAVQGE